MRSELPNELSERGIWWQVAGFTLVALITLAILAEFSGSEARSYRYLEIAATKLYWAFIIPLGGLFEGARKMFEKASEIRAAQRAKMEERWTRRGLEQGIRQGLEEGREEGREKGREEGIKEGRQEGQQELAGRMQEAYERFGIEQDGVIVLPRTPEVEQFLFPSGEFNGRS